MKIFFDFDGTLIDVSDRHYTSYLQAVKSFNGTPLERSEYWRLKRSKTSWEELLNKSGIEKKMLPEFMKKFIGLIESPDLLKLDSVIPGAIEVLSTYSKQDLFLVSLRRHGDLLEQQVKQLGLSEYFSGVLSSHSDQENQLPKVELLESVLSGDDGVVVGDTETDILSAKQLKLISVAVTTGLRDKIQLQKYEPDYLISSVTELPSVLKLA